MEKTEFTTIEQTEIVNALNRKFPDVVDMEVTGATELCSGSNRADYLFHAEYFAEQDVQTLDDIGQVYRFVAGFGIDGNETRSIAIPCVSYSEKPPILRRRRNCRRIPMDTRRPIQATIQSIGSLIPSSIELNEEEIHIGRFSLYPDDTAGLLKPLSRSEDGDKPGYRIICGARVMEYLMTVIPIRFIVVCCRELVSD